MVLLGYVLVGSHIVHYIYLDHNKEEDTPALDHDIYFADFLRKVHSSATGGWFRCDVISMWSQSS